MLRSNWIAADIRFGAYGIGKAGQLFDADILTPPFDAKNLILLSTNGIKATGFQPVRFSVMYYNLPSHF